MLTPKAVLFRVLSQQADRSAVGLLCAEHTLDGGAFSGAVCAKQPEYRAALYREIQMIDYRFSIIGFGQSFDKNGLAHFSILLTARSSI